MTEKVRKSDAEWLRQLTPEQYMVTRQQGTERPFTGKYNACKIPGTYHCVCCGAALFGSAAKFDSGTGWPSFFAPVSGDAVAIGSDDSLGMARDEVLCARCDGVPGEAAMAHQTDEYCHVERIGQAVEAYGRAAL